MIPNRTNDDLAQLAQDIVDHKIFHSGMIHKNDEHLFLSIFLPFVFGVNLDLKEIGFVGEYFDKAGPASINGYPTFFSCMILNKEDTEKLDRLIPYLVEDKSRQKAHVKYLARMVDEQNQRKKELEELNKNETF